MSNLANSAQRVQDALHALGFEHLEVREFSQTTRTSAEAATAIGCEVAQIAKSLVFKGRQSGKAILVIASGVNRVNEKRIASLAGEPIERPDADFVRQQTGFVIGGVPPVGHNSALETWIDEDLSQFEAIWAAAGTPFAVFKLSPADLPRMTGGTVTSIQ